MVNENIFKKISESPELNKTKIGIVCDTRKSFREEGLIVLDLEGKVLGVYNLEDKQTISALGLSEDETKAVRYIGSAYRILHKFYIRRGLEPSLSEVKYLAATFAIPLEKIKSYKNCRNLRDISAAELSIRHNLPIGFTKLRADTLKCEDPDIYLKYASK